MLTHFRFDTNWLLPKYRDLGYVRKAPDSELTKLQRSVIMGVHRRYFRNGNLAAGPSKLDFETLNDAYKALCKFGSHISGKKRITIKVTIKLLYVNNLCMIYAVYYAVMYTTY